MEQGVWRDIYKNKVMRRLESSFRNAFSRNLIRVFCVRRAWFKPGFFSYID